MQGRFLQPWLALWYLVSIIDPIPSAQHASSTPLFRDPLSGSILTVSSMRSELRRLMAAIGRDSSVYGAHSCRIGCATAMAFLQAGGETIKDCGRWKSNAYLRYIRECRREYNSLLKGVCDADVDDFESDWLDVDVDLRDSDFE
jgi:hypothetical protein